MSEIELKFIEDIKCILRSTYTLQDGKQVKGEAISFALSEMRDKGWKGLGNLTDFEDSCENSGFEVTAGRNYRNTPTRVLHNPKQI